MSIYTYRAAVMSTGKRKGATLPDLTGFDVEATDGKIGKVDEATYETDASTLVVDTGFWIFGKKRMIPAGVVESIDTDDKTVVVRMTQGSDQAGARLRPGPLSLRRAELPTRTRRLLHPVRPLLSAPQAVAKVGRRRAQRCATRPLSAAA